jgi:RNA polymerase sigma-70 factor, ECF subfamily
MDLAQTHSSLRAWDWHGLRRRGFTEAHRMLRSREEAEEVVQDAMLRAWRARDRCSQPDTPTPWVLAIVRNEARRRMSGRAPVYLEDVPVPDVSVRDGREHVELTIDVRRALENLEDIDRALIGQRYGADLTYEKLAEAFGMPEGTVKVRLHRARKRLRAVLKEQS